MLWTAVGQLPGEEAVVSRISVAPTAAPPAPQSRAWLLLFHTVGVFVGLGAATLVAYHLARLGPGLASGAPLVHDVLALDTAPGATALGSGSPLLTVAVLSCATVGAGTLLSAVCAAAWPQHRRAAHRLTTIGLWVVLVVGLVAMLPIAGNPLGTSWPSAAGPSGFEWHPAPKALALAAAAGLLLSAITSRPHRQGGERRSTD